jgi:hypothetical protein
MNDKTGNVVDENPGNEFSISGCKIFWEKTAGIPVTHREAIKQELVNMSDSIRLAMKFTQEYMRKWDNPRDLRVIMGFNRYLLWEELPRLHMKYYLELAIDESSILDVVGQVEAGYPIWILTVMRELRDHPGKECVGWVVNKWPPTHERSYGEWRLRGMSQARSENRELDTI